MQESYDQLSRGGAPSALLSLQVDRGAAETLSRQIYVQLRDLILSGRIAAGARLPSTRTLAADLGVSRMVPLWAYDQLTAEGYLAARRGSGLYVERLERQAPVAGPAREAPPPASVATPAADALFSLSGQDTAAFPHAVWARLLARGWRRAATAGGLDDPAGLHALRAAVARHVHILRGVACAADQVLITLGNHESLQLIAQLPHEGRRQAWVEDPGYAETRRALAGAGVAPAPVPVDGQGLNVQAGRALAPAAGLAVVTPARQYPTGAPMSLQRRLALIAWAREADALIVEDDYDSEMRFAGRPLASLASLEPARVLSLDSFSKLTFPGLRLGSIVGPPGLIRRLVALRAIQSSQTASVAQPALAEFLDTGGMARHLRGVRRRLSQRRQALIGALQARLAGDLLVQPQEVGRHFLATLGPRLLARTSDVAIAERAAATGLRLAALSPYYLQAPPRQGLLFGYGGPDEAQIVEGVERLASVLDGLMS